MNDQHRAAMQIALEACPYTKEELRGAFYDGFIKASQLVAEDKKQKLIDLCKRELDRLWQEAIDGRNPTGFDEGLFYAYHAILKELK